MKISPKVSIKMKMKPTLAYALWAIGIASIVGAMVFLYLNLGNLENVFAAGSTYTSAATGNWTTNATWSGGVAPPTTLGNGDNINITNPRTVTAPTITVPNNGTFNIAAGATLNIVGNLVVNNNLTLNVSGTLIITGNLVANNNADITINGGGKVTVQGSATFANNANLLVNGSLSVAGALSFGTNPVFNGSGTVALGSGCAFWSGAGTCTTGTLPIKLLSFNAENINGTIKITWKTASEDNNEFFTIERTADGVNYSPIVTIPGAGTTLKPSSYAFEDTSPLNGRSYYRLSQTDYDGKSETFSPVTVEVATSEELIFRMFPNPLKGNTLTISIPKPEEGIIEILDVRGNKIASRVVEKVDSDFQITLSDNVQPGFYYVNYKTASGSKVEKLLKQ